MPYALPPVVVRKQYMCPLDPSRPLSQRKFYVKIHEMCQNTSQSMLNFFLFPVVNGQCTCCSSVESPITTIFVCPYSSNSSSSNVSSERRSKRPRCPCPPPCLLAGPTSKIPVPPMLTSCTSNYLAISSVQS